MTQPCRNCGASNPPGFKFCAQCGQPLAQACVRCGAPLAAGARFCGNCGASQAAPTPAPVQPERARPVAVRAEPVAVQAAPIAVQPVPVEPEPAAEPPLHNQLALFRGHSGRVTAVAASPDGRYALSGDDKGNLHLWDLLTGKLRTRLPGHKAEILAVAFSPDARLALSAGGFVDRTIRIWDVDAGSELVQMVGHTGGVTSALFSPDGGLVLSGSEDNTVRLWEVKCGFELERLTGHTKPLLSVGFAPDGKRALSAANDMTMRIWDLEGDREVRRAWLDAAFQDLVYDVAFSPDGLYALSTDPEGIRLWELASGTKVRTLAGHHGNIFAVAFSPEGRLALSCSGTDYYDDRLRQELGGIDNTVRLWDVASGREMSRFEGHAANVNCVAFVPDGRALSGSSDGTVRLWSLSA